MAKYNLPSGDDRPWRHKPRARVSVPEKQLQEQLSFNVRPSLRAQLMSLAYLRFHTEQYGFIARELLEKGVREYVAVELDPDERAEYNRIYEAVEAQLKVRYMEKMERRTRKANAEMAAAHESETDMPPEVPIPPFDG